MKEALAMVVIILLGILAANNVGAYSLNPTILSSEPNWLSPVYDEIDSLFENEDADSLTEIDSRLALTIQKKSDNPYLIFRLTAIRNYLQDSRIALTYPSKVSSIEGSTATDVEGPYSEGILLALSELFG